MNSRHSGHKKYHKVPSTPKSIKLSDRDKSRKTSGTPKFKVIFLGNQSVGKTSIISKFVYDKYDANYHVIHMHTTHPCMHMNSQK